MPLLVVHFLRLSSLFLLALLLLFLAVPMCLPRTPPLLLLVLLLPLLGPFRRTFLTCQLTRLDGKRVRTLHGSREPAELPSPYEYRVRLLFDQCSVRIVVNTLVSAELATVEVKLFSITR